MALRRAYIEPSAWDAAWRSGMAPVDFSVLLQNGHYVPVTGHTTLHELGRMVVYGFAEKAKALFSFLRAVDPTFHLPTDELSYQELLFLTRGTPVDPDLDPANIAATAAELRLLADGNISSELAAMIRDRDRDKATAFPESTNAYLDLVRSLRRGDPRLAPRPAGFADSLAFFGGQMPRFLQALSPGNLSDDEARSAWDRRLEIPVHHSHVMVWQYLIFICLRDGRVPGKDRLDDLRHIVEAAYCDVLVTNDSEQAKTLVTLELPLKPLHFGELANGAA